MKRKHLERQRVFFIAGQTLTLFKEDEECVQSDYGGFNLEISRSGCALNPPVLSLICQFSEFDVTDATSHIHSSQQLEKKYVARLRGKDVQYVSDSVQGEGHGQVCDSLCGKESSQHRNETLT